MPIFGFLKKKKPEHAEELETIEVGLEELREWFDQSMADLIRDKRKESEERYNRVVEHIDHIKQGLVKLDRARITSSERVHIASNMIKESFVKKNYNVVTSLVSFTQQGFRPEYQYFWEFHQKGLQAMKDLKDSTPKQTILLSRYFKRESGELVDSIKKAEDALKEFGEYLKLDSGAFGIKERIRRMVSESESIMEEESRLDSRARDLKSEIERSRERKAALEKEYLDLLKSKDWNKVNKLEDEIKQEKEKLSNSEVRIVTELSSVRRPLKKIEHDLARFGKLSPIQKNTLRDFIRDPLKSIVSGSGEKDLLKTLKSIKKQIDSNKVDLKDREQLQVDDLLERLDADIPGLKSDYLELKSSLEEKETRFKQLSDLSRTKQGLENEIGRIGEESGRLEQDLREVSGKRSGIRDRLKEKAREIETVILEEAQKKVSIRLSDMPDQ
jgi:predicted nuclease with TOPRIM domain